MSVRWRDRWDAELDAVLTTLPESDDCSPDLFRILAVTPSAAAKRFAIVLDDGEPVGIAAIRSSGRRWEPVTHWIVPGMIWPIRPEYLAQSLVALGVDLELGWWRQATPPPASKWIEHVDTSPTYGMSCKEDFERYWRSQGHLNDVQRTRKRTGEYRLAVDEPGSAEWTIRNWERFWRPSTMEMPSLSDRLAAAAQLEREGRHHTIGLLDGGKLVAGHTFVVHRNELVSVVSYRDREYQWQMVGNRVLDHAFFWAAAHGYDAIDLGGGHDYKRRWAPPFGSRSILNSSPAHIQLARRLKRRLVVLRRTAAGPARAAQPAD